MALSEKTMKNIRRGNSKEVIQAREDVAFARKRQAEGRIQLDKPISGFSSLAYVAFEETFKQIYEQSLEESTRLHRNNAILKEMEEQILNEDVLAEMTIGQKIELFQLLRESNASSVKMLLEFSKVFKEIRSQVGFYEGLQGTAVGRSMAAATPGALIENDKENRRGLEALTLLEDLEDDEEE